MIADALAEVRERIAAAATRAGRDPAGVLLVGASKTVPVEALAEGARRRADRSRREPGPGAARQGAGARGPRLPPTWHFVGQLQRNKVAGLVPWVSCWHSVDRFPLGEAIARRAPGAGCWSR